MTVTYCDACRDETKDMRVITLCAIHENNGEAIKYPNRYIRQERERCAKVVENFTEFQWDKNPIPFADSDLNETDTKKLLANKIRSAQC